MSSRVAAQQLSILMIGFLTYLSLPFIFFAWLMYELESGSFPTEADSIGIPMAGFLLLWIVGLVFAVVVGAIYVWRRVLNKLS